MMATDINDLINRKADLKADLRDVEKELRRLFERLSEPVLIAIGQGLVRPTIPMPNEFYVYCRNMAENH